MYSRVQSGYRTPKVGIFELIPWSAAYIQIWITNSTLVVSPYIQVFQGLCVGRVKTFQGWWVKGFFWTHTN